MEITYEKGTQMQRSILFNLQNCKYHSAESYPVSHRGVSTQYDWSAGIHTERKTIKRVNGRLRQAVLVQREWIIYRMDLHSPTLLWSWLGTEDTRLMKTSALQLSFKLYADKCQCVCLWLKWKNSNGDISHDLVSQHACRLNSRARLLSV